MALAALAFVVLSGCSGLPTFHLPGSNGAGGGAEAGRAQNGLLGSEALPGETSAPAPAPDDTGSADAAGGAEAPLAPAAGPLPDAGAGPTVTLPSGTSPGWLVRFTKEAQAESMKQTANDNNAVFVFAFRSLPIAYMLASDVDAQSLMRDPRVVAIEREAPLQFHDAESRQAIRLPQVVHPVTGVKDPYGNPLDGRHVGIAVVDTGINAMHSDLPYGPAVPGGVVAANYKVESNQYIALQNTDTTAGHGTHVAAIVAGQGVGDASVKGVAPGARLYGLGIGDASTTVWAAQAFDWILQNHNQVTPRIKVVTNSWGTTGTYSPTSTTTLYVNALVAQGITVVFSAGNRGGDGSTAQTSPECQNPRQGVICVAAYDDLGTGTQNGQVASYTSRGALAQASTWPDLSAPGSNVLSARPPVGSITGFGTNLDYVQLSGTSQAAPHVAGTVALMLQKHPGMTPAAVEATLESTAHKFTDGGAYSGGSHYAKGAGLLDAYAAVLAV